MAQLQQKTEDTSLIEQKLKVIQPLKEEIEKLKNRTALQSCISGKNTQGREYSSAIL